MVLQKIRGLHFLLICMLLGIFPGCTGDTERAKIPEYKPAKVVPLHEPAPEVFWPLDVVTPQSAISREVRNRKTPSLAREFMQSSLTLGSPIYIRIFKENRALELWVEQGETFVLYKTYPIASFSGSLGSKFFEGDLQAPEGFYYVFPSMMNPNSMFHLAFNIGYPNLYDRTHQRTGSAIMVHGSTVSVGCFAMTDRYIEDIYTIADYALNTGQPFFRVHVFPFQMTRQNMDRHASSPHIAFWENLKEGYLYFERHRRPPNVIVVDKMYVFEHDQQDASYAVTD